LSLGCGIADTELLIAPHVKELVGIDLSRAAVRQAQTDARRLGLSNVHFRQGTLWDINDKFDVVVGIFFLHHLSDTALHALPEEIYRRLRPGGVFYSLDPSVSRLSGRIGRILLPRLMKRYNTEDERELSPAPTAAMFRAAGFAVRSEMYDFGSTPLAGLLPGWRFGYNVARRVDDIILKFPPLRRWGSNFEIIARRNQTS
jgi:SAM-dependent methyltransferase